MNYKDSLKKLLRNPAFKKEYDALEDEFKLIQKQIDQEAHMGVYEVKQLIIIRKDLGMNKGKLAVQAAHASLGALLRAFEETSTGQHLVYTERPTVQYWLENSFAKIALAVNSEEELQACYDLALQNGLLASYIEDNGVTVFNGVKTPTCVGVGPADSATLDLLFGNLKLY